MNSPVGSRRVRQRQQQPAADNADLPNPVDNMQQPEQPQARAGVFIPPRPEWMRFVNDRVAPYVASVWFMSAVFLNPALDPWTPAWTRVILPYIFSAAFFSYVIFTVAYWVEYLVRRGFFQWLRKFLGKWAEYVWKTLLRTQRLYWVKFVLGCLLITLSIFIVTWLHQHLDLGQFIISTWQLFWNVLRSLLNVADLARFIQEWTNQQVLSWIVNPTSAVLAFALQYVIEYPVKGAFVIIATLIGTVATALGGLALKECWYGNGQRLQPN